MVSGNLTVSNIENGPVEIVDLSTKNGDLNHSDVKVYQRVPLCRRRPQIEYQNVVNVVRWNVRMYVGIHVRCHNMRLPGGDHSENMFVQFVHWSNPTEKRAFLLW